MTHAASQIVATERFIGILSLDTAFPRIPGDVGAPESYPFPVRKRVVLGADAPLVARRGAPDARVVASFKEAARALEAEGAVALITTCGFFARAQAELASAVSIPFVASALSLAPLLAASLAPGRLGVLSADGGALEPADLRAVGLDPARAVVVGFEADPLWRSIILQTKAAQARSFDRGALEKRVAARAAELVAASPDVAGLLLECGNLPPYAAAISAAASRPVWSVLDLAEMLWRGAAPRAFPGAAAEADSLEMGG